MLKFGGKAKVISIKEKYKDHGVFFSIVIMGFPKLLMGSCESNSNLFFSAIIVLKTKNPTKDCRNNLWRDELKQQNQLKFILIS